MSLWCFRRYRNSNYPRSIAAELLARGLRWRQLETGEEDSEEG